MLRLHKQIQSMPQYVLFIQVKKSDLVPLIRFFNSSHVLRLVTQSLLFLEAHVRETRDAAPRRQKAHPLGPVHDHLGQRVLPRHDGSQIVPRTQSESSRHAWFAAFVENKDTTAPPREGKGCIGSNAGARAGFAAGCKGDASHCSTGSKQAPQAGRLVKEHFTHG